MDSPRASQGATGLRPTTSGSEPSALADLIARVEAATGADRELDALILPLDDPSLAVHHGAVWRGRLCYGSLHDSLPTYTSSLDAALGLAERVLPGRAVTTTRTAYGFGLATVYAAELHHADAPTPALALCLATLRAVARERSETVAATGLEADPGCKTEPSNG